MMYCKHCGKPLEENAHFCMFCGAPVTENQPTQNGAAEKPKAPAPIFRDPPEAPAPKAPSPAEIVASYSRTSVPPPKTAGFVPGAPQNGAPTSPTAPQGGAPAQNGRPAPVGNDPRVVPPMISPHANSAPIPPYAQPSRAPRERKPLPVKLIAFSGGGAVILIALIVFLCTFFSASSRLDRALAAADTVTAQQIITENTDDIKFLLKHTKEAQNYMDGLCKNFGAGEMTLTEVCDRINAAAPITSATPYLQRISAINASREAFSVGEYALSVSDPMTAVSSFAEVIPEDTKNYDLSREKYSLAKKLYCDPKIEEAKKLVAEKADTRAAYQLLKVIPAEWRSPELEKAINLYQKDIVDTALAEISTADAEGNFILCYQIIKDTAILTNDSSLQLKLGTYDERAARQAFEKLKGKIYVRKSDDGRYLEMADGARGYLDLSATRWVDPSLYISGNEVYFEFSVGFLASKNLHIKDVSFAIPDARTIVLPAPEKPKTQDVGKIGQWNIYYHNPDSAASYSQGENLYSISLSSLAEAILADKEIKITIAADTEKSRTLSAKEKSDFKTMWNLYQILEAYPDLRSAF